MNYLKNISNIKHLRDLEIEEETFLKTRREAAQIVKEISLILSGAEQNADQHLLWDAINKIAEVLYYTEN